MDGDNNMAYSRNIQNQNFANNNTKNKSLNLFGNTRSLTAEEHEIYKKILYQGAKKTALKVWQQGETAMREILFRGKRVDNGEWVQGYSCRYGWIGKEKDYIIPDYASTLYAAEVDPETVGQYTGLTDKNGNKIFEGDIVWDNCEEERGVVQWYNDMAKFIITYSTFTVDFDNVYGEELQIVGNVYDNAELIKEKQ